MEKPGILSTSGITSFIAIMILMVFFQTQAHDFVNMGDSELIYNNPHIKSGICSESLKWALFSTREGVWMPLTRLSYILDFKFHRLNPTWYHLENMFIHIFNSILLFLILKRTTRKVLRSAFAAALFALHPINVEAVAWAAGRKDVLSAFFFLLSVAGYIFYLKKPSTQRYLGLTVFFLLGVFSLPTVAVLPAALLLLDWWPLNRVGVVKTAALLKEKIPLMAISILSGIIAIFSYYSGGYLAPSGSIPFYYRIANAMVSYISYLGKFVFPFNFAAFYPHPANGFDLWKGAAALIILSIITYLILKLANRIKFFIFGWLWFLAILLPVSGLFHQGFEAMADRYAYISFIGLFVIAAWGIPELFEKYMRNFKYKYLNYFCIGLLIFLAILSRMETSNWRTSITLYEHAATSVSNNYFAYDGLGTAMAEKGSLNEAVVFYKKAISANPYYDRSYYNLGMTLLKLGKTDEAFEVFGTALKINSHSPEANFSLGSIMLADGKYDQAESYLQNALRARPDFLEAMNALGIVEKGRNNPDKALEYFRAVVKSDPTNADAYKQMGIVYFKEDNLEAGEVNLRKALTLNPWDAEAHLKLGELLDKKGNKPEARRHYLEALRINPELRNAIEKVYE
jgi:protein O-mannosyl-transferase